MARSIGPCEQIGFLVIGGFARGDPGEAAGGHAQVVDVLRGDLEAVEGTGQLAAVVEEGDWQPWSMLADGEFGFRIAQLGGQRGAAVVANLLACAAIIGQDGIRAAPAAAVEAIGVLSGSIEAELQGALGVAGGKAQVEALAPAANSRGGRVFAAEVPVEVKVAQAQVERAERK